MQIFHKLLEDVHHRLLEVEREKARWQPVPDVMLDSLQDEIDTCKVVNWFLLHVGNHIEYPSTAVEFLLDFNFTFHEFQI